MVEAVAQILLGGGKDRGGSSAFSVLGFGSKGTERGRRGLREGEECVCAHAGSRDTLESERCRGAVEAG